MILRSPTENENDEFSLDRFPGASSFPRRRESRFVLAPLAWIPTFAGMMETLRFTLYSGFFILKLIDARYFEGAHEGASAAKP